MTTKRFRGLAIFLLATAVGCDDGQKATPEPVITPHAPTAVSRGDQVVYEGELVKLDGSGSTDKDGDIASYAWTQTGDGDAVTLSDANTAIATFTAPDVGETMSLRFSLTVTDRTGIESSTSVSITIIDLNVRPTVAVGVDRQVIAGDTVSFCVNDTNNSTCGTASDPDGSITGYSWSVATGPIVVITNWNTASAQLTAPDVTEPTDIVVQLEVTDNEGKSATDTLLISIEPVATALFFSPSSIPNPVLRNISWGNVQVAVRNSSGATIVGGAASTLDISVAVKSGTGTTNGVLSGVSTPVAASSGIATFSSLRYNEVTATDAGVVLEATTPGGLTGETATPIDVTWPNEMPGTLSAGVDIVPIAGATIDDGTGTDVVVVGRYQGTSVDFDLAAGAANLKSSTGTDGFVARYDGGDGTLEWVQTYSSAGQVEVVGVATTLSNEIYIVVAYDSVALGFPTDPGGGAGGTPILAGSPAGFDTAIAKLDGDGWTDWVYDFGGSNDDIPSAIALDVSGNAVVVGSFRGVGVEFERGNSATATDSNTNTVDAFVLKIDATGAYAWHIAYGGNQVDVATSVGIRRSNGDIYFGGSTDTEAFVSKLLSDSTEDWTHVFGGDGGNNLVNALTVDPFGRLYAFGQFEGTGDFDPDATGISTLTAVNNADAFAMRFEADGAHVWSESFGGVENVRVNAAMLREAATDSLIITGSFMNTVDFDPGAGQNDIASANGLEAAFVMSLDTDGVFEWAGALEADTATTMGTMVAVNPFRIWVGGHIAGDGNVDIDPTATMVPKTVPTNDVGAYFLKMDIGGKPAP
ncbi:MAG: PKD domain-containing protein [Myxococcota bacterium]